MAATREPATAVTRTRRRSRSRPRPTLATPTRGLPSTSSLVASTSILFAATAARAEAAPPRPEARSDPNLTPRQLEKSRAIEQLDSASTSIYSLAPSTVSRSTSRTTTTAPLDPTRTPPPSAPKARRRQILPKYEFSDGSWIVDTGWTLRGSIPTSHLLHTRHRATALADTVETASVSLSPAPTRSRSPPSPHVPSTATTSTSTRTPIYTQHAYASASEVPIPRGWQTRPRETDYYAVPIIISMSVLVAIAVVIAILGSVCWRKKKRRRRDPEKDYVQEKGWRGIVQRATRGRRQPAKRRKRKVKKPVEGDRAPVERDVVEVAREADGQSLRESVGSTGSGSRTPRIVRTTGFAAVSERSRPRWRNRRRRDGEQGNDASDDEATALTRSETRSTTSSADPRDALTARLAARLHGPSNRDRSGPSTVFSRLPERNRSSSSLSNSHDPFPRTSTQDSHLTRSTSRSSLYQAVVSPPSILFTPADDPTLSPRPPGSPAFEPLSLSRVPSRSAPIPSPALVHSDAPTDPLLPVVPPSIPTSTASSFNALLSHDADLALPLMPGPPAYRPASSTVQTTRRYGAGDSPAAVPRTAISPSATSSRLANLARRRRVSAVEGPPPLEDGQRAEWHWPGEKGRRIEPSGGEETPGTAGPSSSSAFVLSNDEGADEEQEHEEEAEPPFDRSLYQAHLATDDKSVLNRLRTAYRPQSDGEEDNEGGGASRPMIPVPSAPAVEDEVDEDGFERFDPEVAAASVQRGEDEESRVGFSTSEKAKLRAPPSLVHRSTSSLLPAPPTRGDFTYSYLSRNRPASSATSPEPSTSKSALAAEYAAMNLPGDDDVELDLPVYLAQERRSQTLGLASAPPASHDEEDDDEDDAATEERTDGEGITYATI
ncbi:hypothetical protein JCM11491_001242 [Sporobolomyces phaffii]